MMPRVFFHVLVSLVCLSAIAPACRAGQVTVDVGPDGLLTFAPREVNINLGDQVVWIWRSGTHKVIEGTPCSVPESPIFQSAGLVGSSDAIFGWKADRTGPISYFCRIYCGYGMTGTIHVQTEGAFVSDFRITEVFRTNDHQNDYIEIANLGPVGGSLGSYRLATSMNGMMTIPFSDVPLPPGGRVVIHAGASGTSTPTEMYLPDLMLPALGSVALYLPTTTGNKASTQMVDFVQWGGASYGDLSLRDDAITEGLWFSFYAAPVMPAGSALEFCGTSGQYGAAHWAVVSQPNPGADGACLTPTRPATWGYLKSLRRQ